MSKEERDDIFKKNVIKPYYVNIENKNTFHCFECGTYYHTSSEDPPPSPKWDDGHVCKMIKIDK